MSCISVRSTIKKFGISVRAIIPKSGCISVRAVFPDDSINNFNCVPNNCNIRDDVINGEKGLQGVFDDNLKHTFQTYFSVNNILYIDDFVLKYGEDTSSFDLLKYISFLHSGWGGYIYRPIQKNISGDSVRTNDVSSSFNDDFPEYCTFENIYLLSSCAVRNEDKVIFVSDNKNNKKFLLLQGDVKLSYVEMEAITKC